MAATYTLLDSVTLTGFQSTVNFTNIDQSYKHLAVTIERTTSSASSATYMRLNSDSGSSSYKDIMVFAESNLSGFAIQSDSRGFILQTIGSTSDYAASQIDIFDYSSTSKRTSLYSKDLMQDVVTWQAMTYVPTTAITEINFFNSSGSFSAGSTFAIFGIEG